MDRPTAGTERGAFSPEDIKAHAEHDHLAAVFADRDRAATAVEDLRALGLGSEHLGLAVHGDDEIVFEHDEQADLLRDTEIGALAGIPLGMIAGIGLAALAVPGIGVVGVGGMLGIAGVSALWGGLLGSFFGATAGESGWIAHEDVGHTGLQKGEVLVVVCSHGHADAVQDIMQRHDGRLHTIETPQP